jgi:carbon-monoxide dehydrogenase medium subunit
LRLHRPESLADAVALLAEHGDDARPLAGGQSLVPLLALRLSRPAHLVDLERVPGLTGIDTDGGGEGEVAVGAMARQRDVGADRGVGEAVPLVARAVPLIGHFQIRNRGTVGGSLAHADPAAELAAVALALDAALDVVGPHGPRTVPSDDFFVDRWTTALAPDELLVRIRFPRWARRCGFAIDEVARRHGDFAMVGVACGLGLGADGRIERARVALFGVGATPLRAASTEAALQGRGARDLDVDALRELGALATRDLDPPADVHATGEYRRAAGALIVARALGAALAEASRDAPAREEVARA